MNRTRWQKLGVSIFMVLLCIATLEGCKKKEPKDKDKATAAASSAGGAGGASGESAGPCKEYADKLCDIAGGKDAPVCASIGSATEMMSPATCTAGLKDIKYSTDKYAEKRKKCDELEQRLCTAIGPETETCKMVKEQTKKFPPERCEQMLPRFDEIVADLKKREEANKPLTAEMQATIAGGNAPAFGSPSATVTVVEFSDFQCPYCSRAANVVQQVKQKYGDKVRFVFRQFPLSFHEHAKSAAEAALAANAQGKFWEYHDILFKNQQKLEPANLEDYAKQVGLNVAAFKASIDKHEHAAQVEADMKLGEQVAVQGTPTMFINGARVANPSDFDALSKQIDAALAKPSAG